jgi:hypothetical protein
MFLFTYRSWVQILRMDHSSSEGGSTRKQPEHGVTPGRERGRAGIPSPARSRTENSGLRFAGQSPQDYAVRFSINLQPPAYLATDRERSSTIVNTAPRSPPKLFTIPWNPVHDRAEYAPDPSTTDLCTVRLPDRLCFEGEPHDAPGSNVNPTGEFRTMSSTVQSFACATSFKTEGLVRSRRGRRFRGSGSSLDVSK